AGAATLDVQACSPRALVDDATDALRASAERRDVTFRVQATGDVRVPGDPRRLAQVLEHLLDNAVKFSHAGGVVEINVEASAKDVRVSVRDHGRGIPPDKLEVIFERFRQLDVSDARPTGGAGLGLAICKSIVEAHGGLIRA